MLPHRCMSLVSCSTASHMYSQYRQAPAPLHVLWRLYACPQPSRLVTSCEVLCGARSTDTALRTMVLQSSPSGRGSPGSSSRSACAASRVEAVDLAKLDENLCPWVRQCPSFSSSGAQAAAHRKNFQRICQALLDCPEDHWDLQRGPLTGWATTFGRIGATFCIAIVLCLRFKCSMCCFDSSRVVRFRRPKQSQDQCMLSHHSES